jgi:putative tryptophan/tyrosine transport system substrate-binding protein
MRRREFIGLVGGAAAWPLGAVAQQSVMPVVGMLYGVAVPAENMAGFRRGLAEAGFSEGRNVAIEYRSAEGRYERLPGMAADLISRKVSAILAGGALDAVRAAMSATRTVPIVFTTTTDPVAAGLVGSLNRPGANVTGVTGISKELTPKRLELLREAIPTANRVAILVNPANPVGTQEATQGAQMAARGLGLEIIVVDASTDSAIEAAIATAVQQRAAALHFDDAYFSSRRDQVVALALRYALPTITGTREFVTAGALMSYGASVPDYYRQAGLYVGRILKGEKPADLPVMQPTKFELVVNLKTAKAIGLTIPETFLVRADEVIE